MQFTDIKNKVYFLTATNSSSFPVADLTAEANTALDRVVSLILQADGRWQFEDNNNTDLPIATAALVSGQQDYTLTTAHLKILDVHVKDSAGTWYALEPMDAADYNGEALENMAAGAPREYDIIGSSVLLYPTPNYSQAASLKLFYQRGASYFTTADTTKEAGFASHFHELIPLWVAYNFAIANGKQNASLLFAEIDRKEKELVKHYGHRNKDDTARMTMARINHR
ncbi:hypothetical protein [Bradyrhizobium sp. AUGA SZCCT0431]|uniref:phage adaptor protein n=1 Tax=Bradyrhizobium sp. AUGA SZCCT0431 TaxID=2807674 RepID=UPI001BAD63B7|nr:hypothetical protein [Bradyrhizobium sp. AUGA SZCCT0431]MBR1146678.1 hypothetical protein [Bradyrhizobium sp. AUGA SZCCT0431]